VEVRVSDRGKGIGVEEARALFEPFYRGEDVGGIAGLGIGLSVCKRFAEAEGGFMSAKPREDGGSEFTLSLPCAAEELAEPASDLVPVTEPLE